MSHPHPPEPDPDDDLDAGEDLPPVPPAPPGTRYLVSDGTLSLMLEVAEPGGYLVTCPFDEELNTQAESIEEAFAMAYDLAGLLGEIREERDQRSARPLAAAS